MKLFPIKSLLETSLEFNKMLEPASKLFEDINLIGILFLVDWHPSSQNIVSFLKNFYERTNSQSKKLELVFCSADDNEQEYNNITQNMPWLIIPYSNNTVREQLLKNTEINVMPTLIIINTEGKQISSMRYDDIYTLDDSTVMEWRNQLTEPINRIVSGKYIIGDKAMSICHPHQLTYADYLLKIPEYRSGNWFCDECGLSFGKNITNFYCALCGYDLCDSCFQKNK